MICLRQETAVGDLFYALDEPIFVRRLRNGVIVRVESPALAWGVVSPDGFEIWQLAGRGSLGEGYPIAEETTRAEYEQWLAAREAGSAPEVPDPEDTEPLIPEGVDPVTVLTRAELTERVTELDEALHMLLSGVTEDG